MRFLISNELAIQYNLFGSHGKKRFRDLRLLTSYVVNVFYCLTTHTDLCVKHFSQYTLTDTTILKIILNHSVRHPRINNNHNARFTLLRLQCVCSSDARVVS